MILRPVLADTLIWSVPISPEATFQAGMIAGLTEINGQLFVTPSDGTNVLGIIDDDRTSAFSGNSIDEVSIVPAPYVEQNGVLVSTIDVMGSLEEVNIIQSSFVTNIDLVLNPKKGTFVVPSGTPLNYEEDINQITTFGFEVQSSYRYQIADFPGADTTDGTGLVSIHFRRGIFTTNVFDVLSTINAGSDLYVNIEGVLTSQATTSPVVAIALQPASSLNQELMFMWL